MSKTAGVTPDPQEFSFKDWFSKFNRSLEFQTNQIFKQTVYNVIGCFLIFSGCFATYGAFMVLNPFLKPLLWALLCGSVMYPFKVRISNTLQLCIDSLDKPSIVHLIADGVSYPFLLYDHVSQSLSSFIFRNFIPVAIIVIVSCFHFTVPQFSFGVVCKTYDVVLNIVLLIMELGGNSLIVVPMVLTFVWVVLFKWQSVDKEILSAVSVITWLSLICYISSFTNIFHFPVFVASVCLFLYSWMYSDGNSANEVESVQSISVLESSVNLSTQAESLSPSSFKQTKYSEIGQVKKKLSQRRKFKSQLSFVAYNPILPVDEQSEHHIGDQYLYWVGFACGFMFFIKWWWTPFLIGLHLIVYFIRNMCKAVGFHIFFHDTCLAFIKEKAYSIFDEGRLAVVFPPLITNVYQLAVLCKSNVLKMLKNSCDALATSLVMLFVIIFVIFSTVFVTMQVYTEGVYIVKVGSKLLNDTLVFNDKINVVPENWQNHLESAFENAYMYGRDLISKMIRKLSNGIHEDKIIELEKMFLELYDRVFQAWISATDDKVIGPKVTSDAVYQVWDTFTLNIEKTSALLNIHTIMQFVNNNMTLLSSTMKNLWEFLMDNVSLIFYLLDMFLSIILVSGSTVFGLIIDLIIFMTALFYLLVSSGEMYKPVEFITKVSPNYGNKLAVAIERSVTEVFMVSGKLSLFYGLYTWFLHNLFQMPIIYVPTFIATILASVPFLPTYVVCLPGVLDLWLLKGKPAVAILLLLSQVTPTYFVDAAIYEDIHGGHPYLTGLAMAGGVLYFGIEGAIIGPLVLCLLLVIMNFFASLMQEHYGTSGIESHT